MICLHLLVSLLYMFIFLHSCVTEEVDSIRFYHLQQVIHEWFTLIFFLKWPWERHKFCFYTGLFQLYSVLLDSVWFQTRSFPLQVITPSMWVQPSHQWWRETTMMFFYVTQTHKQCRTWRCWTSCSVRGFLRKVRRTTTLIIQFFVDILTKHETENIWTSLKDQCICSTSAMLNELEMKIEVLYCRSYIDVPFYSDQSKVAFCRFCFTLF